MPVVNNVVLPLKYAETANNCAIEGSVVGKPTATKVPVDFDKTWGGYVNVRESCVIGHAVRFSFLVVGRTRNAGRPGRREYDISCTRHGDRVSWPDSARRRRLGAGARERWKCGVRNWCRSYGRLQRKSGSSATWPQRRADNDSRIFGLPMSLLPASRAHAERGPQQVRRPGPHCLHGFSIELSS